MTRSRTHERIGTLSQQIDMHEAHQEGATDPVCGMTVDPDDAKDRGLSIRHENVDYFFCGKGCKLEFSEDPPRYLAADYSPHM